MAKRVRDLGTPTVLVQYVATTPEERAEIRRAQEKALSDMASRQLGFSVIATIDPGKPPEHYGETRICHGNEVIYPNRMKKEDLPPWAVDVLTTFGFTSDYGNATVRR